MGSNSSGINITVDLVGVNPDSVRTFRILRQAQDKSLLIEKALNLHAGKDLAVSPFDFTQGKPFAIRKGHRMSAYTKAHPTPLQNLGVLVLSRKDVTARTSYIAVDGRYPLPLSNLIDCMLGLSSPRQGGK